LLSAQFLFLCTYSFSLVYISSATPSSYYAFADVHPPPLCLFPFLFHFLCSCRGPSSSALSSSYYAFADVGPISFPSSSSFYAFTDVHHLQLYLFPFIFHFLCIYRCSLSLAISLSLPLPLSMHLHVICSSSSALSSTFYAFADVHLPHFYLFPFLPLSMHLLLFFSSKFSSFIFLFLCIYSSFVYIPLFLPSPLPLSFSEQLFFLLNFLSLFSIYIKKFPTLSLSFLIFFRHTFYRLCS
jgi:hypothetical protein